MALVRGRLLMAIAPARQLRSLAPNLRMAIAPSKEFRSLARQPRLPSANRCRLPWCRALRARPGDTALSEAGGAGEASQVRVLNADRPFLQDNDFRVIVEGEYCYVDRTHYIPTLLATDTRVLFLRPRRFGKSLWLSTLEEVFSGDPDIFKGLAVYDADFTRRGFRWCPTDPKKHNFPACPVLHFDFSKLTAALTAAKVESAMFAMLRDVGLRHGVRPEGPTPGTMLASLVGELSRRDDNPWKRVVVLIDEYDALWAKFAHTQHADDVHWLMKGFMSVLKAMGEEIEFTFVTGIAPVSLTGMFSGPNDLTDLSLHPKLAGLCGFTQAEVEHILKAQDLQLDMQEVKKFYNGYCWNLNDLKSTLYNPFDIRQLCEHREIGSWWAATSSESVVRILNGPRPELILPTTVSESALTTIANLHSGDRMSEAAVLSFLFHAGYATVRNVSRSSDGDVKLQLDFPNAQAKQLITDDILGYFGLKSSGLAQKSKEAVDCLQATPPDMAGLFKVMNEVLASTASRPSKDAKHYEGFYEIFFDLVLRLDARCEVQLEQNLAYGYVDIVVKLRKPRRTFIFELKIVHGGDEEAWTQAAQRALNQIKEREYDAVVLRDSGGGKQETFKYGVVCDSATKRFSFLMSSTGEKLVLSKREPTKLA